MDGGNEMKNTKKKIDKETKPISKVKAESNGNGKKDKAAEEEEAKRNITAGSINNAFTQSHDKSAVSYLVEAGEIVKDLLLRSSFPSKPSIGGVKVIALAHHPAKCQKYGDTIAEKEALFILAGLPSIDGERTRQLVSAIIGDNTQTNRGPGWSQRVIGKAFGKKEENIG
jgi:hypothetical protein